MTQTVESGAMDERKMREFLEQPILARIATANPTTCRPHVVPVWYEWDGTNLWISSFRSTRKIRELQNNPWVSIIIDDAQSGVDFQSVLFEGRAELVTGPADFVAEKTTVIYTRYLGEQGVLAPDPQSWIRDPENLLIKLTPQLQRAWYSAAVAEAS